MLPIRIFTRPSLAIAWTLAGLSPASAAILRHHYPLDGNGNDARAVTNLTPVGDAVTFPASGGPAGGFLRLGGSDDYLLAAAGSNFSALGTTARSALSA